MKTFAVYALLICGITCAMTGSLLLDALAFVLFVAAIMMGNSIPASPGS